MSRILSFSLILLFTTPRLSAQEGYTRTVNAFSSFYQHQQPDSIYNLFSEGMKKAIPSSSWSGMFNTLQHQIGRLGSFTRSDTGANYINFTAPFSDSSFLLMLSIDKQYHIQGLFNIPAPPGQPASPTNYTIRTDGGSLSATLTLPANPGPKIPVALIIAGSGPVDRDGNTPALQSNSYRALAEQLKEQGIATLRYDKRYIGESKNFNKPIDSLTIEEYIKDAKACIQSLKADPRFSSVTVIGHSEGSLIGMMALIPSGADNFISLAGAGEKAGLILKRQLAFPHEADSLNLLLDSLAMGYRVKPPSLYTNPFAIYFTAKIQAYLISWFRYDPAAEISRVRVPTLIIQGGSDFQVSEKDARLLNGSLPQSVLLLIPSMTHMLKDSDKDRTVNRQLVDAIVQFIRPHPTHK